MGAFDGVRRALRLGVARRELEEELGFHLERTMEELMSEGGSREEAEAEARRRFGDERRWKREIEAVDRAAESRRRWAERLDGAAWVLRLALRRMRRSPGFVAGVVLTFALGIGANATMFGIVDRLLLRPPAHVQDAGAVRRIALSQIDPNSGRKRVQEVLNYPSFEDLRRAHSFSGVAGYTTRDVTLGRGDGAERAKAGLATADFFPLLGTKPEIGRFYGPAEDRVGAPEVVVLSHEYWRTHLGGDRGVLGRTVDFGYGPHIVIGVAPEGFTGVDLERVDLWLPLRAQVGRVAPPEQCTSSRNCWWMQAVARLAPGVSPVTAEAEVTTLYRQGMASETDGAGASPSARADAKPRVIAAPVIAARGPNASSESVVAKWLAGISLIVLLIACANVANLLLARSIRQRREIGVRLALGSSRGQVMAQVLAESLLLALLGGAAALALTQWGGAVVRRVLLPDIAWGAGAVDPRVLGFVVGLTLLTGVVAGLVPAYQASRPAVYEVLRNGTRNASSPISRTRDALTVLQAALSVVLLVGAGLFVRSLRQVEAIDLGVDPDGVLMVEPVWQRDTPEAAQHRFALAAVERLRAHPGVAAAATSASIPFYSLWGVDLRVPGLDSLPHLPGGGPYINAVTADYFKVFGLDVRRGRGFATSDVKGAGLVAVVNETMARTLWPGEEPLGKCLLISYGPESKKDTAPCTRVVGVVENSHRFQLVDEDEAMQYFVHVPQLPDDQRLETVTLRARDDPMALAPTVRRELRALDPRVRYVNVRPFRELIAPSLRSWRLGATMFSLFGGLALLVAGIGLYSVLAFGVAQRTFELGIRSALGASRQRLFSLVVGHALRLVGLGVLLGLGAALLTGPRVVPLLYGVSARDPATFAGVVAVLVGVAFAAAGLPARRATRVDPSIALRSE